MITGAFVGFILGYIVQDKITGAEYGAGRWQRPSDKRYVPDPVGFVRWLSLPLLTAGLGAIVSPVVDAAIMAFIASASIVTLLAGGVAVVGGLYLFFKKFVLGR